MGMGMTAHPTLVTESCLCLALLIPSPSLQDSTSASSCSGLVFLCPGCVVVSVVVWWWWRMVVDVEWGGATGD